MFPDYKIVIYQGFGIEGSCLGGQHLKKQKYFSALKVATQRLNDHIRINLTFEKHPVLLAVV